MEKHQKTWSLAEKLEAVRLLKTEGVRLLSCFTKPNTYVVTLPGHGQQFKITWVTN